MPRPATLLDMESQLIPHEGNKRLGLIENALSIQQVMSQRKLVMEVMREAMTENLHFGKIPGCGDKPTLLQPGAQMLCSVFCLTDSLDVLASDLPGGHREYRVTCTIQAPNGQRWQGVGLATSMETKHRYRSNGASFEDTGEPIPSDSKDRKVEYRKRGFGMKQIEGVWRWVKYSSSGSEDKVENPNPADCFNTVLKMAKKRAYVDATITATACNDLFTQDLEDIRANLDAVEVSSEVQREPQQERREERREEREPDTRDASSKHRQPEFVISEKTTVAGLKVEDVNEANGVNPKKKTAQFPDGTPWKKWGVKLSNGVTAGTFSEAVSQAAILALKDGCEVSVILEPNGKYVNLVDCAQL